MNPRESVRVPWIRQADLRAAELLSSLRVYIHKDWLTRGIAESLVAQAEGEGTSRNLPCLGCGRSFPRDDLWVHHRFADLGYCDACYYRCFGRKST
jgi:hypothetical protein